MHVLPPCAQPRKVTLVLLKTAVQMAAEQSISGQRVGRTPTFYSAIYSSSMNPSNELRIYDRVCFQDVVPRSNTRLFDRDVASCLVEVRLLAISVVDIISKPLLT